jgi:predicted deacetylase
MTAINQYYPVEGVPEFWEWLAHRAAAGDIKILIEMFDEIREGGRGDERDHLFAWIRMEAN